MTLRYGIKIQDELQLFFVKNKTISIKGVEIPVKVEKNMMYITVQQHMLEYVIDFLNQLGKTTYTLNDMVANPIQDYRVREHEHSAFLEALARGGKTWRTKFFVIRDNFLIYFDNDKSYKPEGVIMLEEAGIMLSKEYNHCFEVSTDTRRYHIRTTTEQECLLWVQRLQETSKLTIHSIYDVKETLGEGTFAKVKRCRNKSTGKEFAVKIIDKKMVTDKTSIMTEITIMKNVSHPNIITLHHVFETKLHIYLVMDLLEGGELFDLLFSRGRLSEYESSRLILNIVKGVEYLHSKHICHRDLKPENLLLVTKNNIESIRITDFGLSKIYEKGMKTACGTPSYVAPEILAGEPYGCEVDMWSCGVILYVLLCGFPPFYSEQDGQLYELIKSGSYSFPSPYWDDISENAKDLIRNLLVVDPSKRFTPKQILAHPFVTNYRSLSFNKGMGMNRELSAHLVTQKILKKEVGDKKKEVPVEPFYTQGVT